MVLPILSQVNQKLILVLKEARRIRVLKYLVTGGAGFIGSNIVDGDW